MDSRQSSVNSRYRKTTNVRYCESQDPGKNLQSVMTIKELSLNFEFRLTNEDFGSTDTSFHLKSLIDIRYSFFLKIINYLHINNKLSLVAIAKQSHAIKKVDII